MTEDDAKPPNERRALLRRDLWVATLAPMIVSLGAVLFASDRGLSLFVTSAIAAAVGVAIAALRDAARGAQDPPPPSKIADANHTGRFERTLFVLHDLKDAVQFITPSAAITMEARERVGQALRRIKQADRPRPDLSAPQRVDLLIQSAVGSLMIDSNLIRVTIEACGDAEVACETWWTTRVLAELLHNQDEYERSLRADPNVTIRHRLVAKPVVDDELGAMIELRFPAPRERGPSAPRLAFFSSRDGGWGKGLSGARAVLRWLGGTLVRDDDAICVRLPLAEAEGP
jgi:hypothetical protein